MMSFTHIPFENDQQLIARLNAGIHGLQALIKAADNLRANYQEDAEDLAIADDCRCDNPITNAELFGWSDLDDALKAVESFRDLSSLHVSVDFLGRESDDDACSLLCLVDVHN